MQKRARVVGPVVVAASRPRHPETLDAMSKPHKPHWYPAYVGLGSNLQGPAGQLQAAIEMLGKLAGTRVTAQSSMYRSAPFGGIEQPDFMNAAVSLLTQRSARELLAELQQIESLRGRDGDEVRWGPRVIDLDLLVYGGEMIAEPDLVVPHPGIAERNFVLLPLREIAPELIIPGLGRLASLAVNVHQPHIKRIE
jgi:2-amino-4-hydroxy-6-hydroxymethyldihydropteridine diphosphokinase